MRALLVELDGPAEVDALQAEIERRRRDGRLPALEEVVSAARTILIDGLADPAAAFARDLSDWNVPPAPVGEGALVEVPTNYDGPDLANWARQLRTTIREVIATHNSADHGRHRVAVPVSEGPGPGPRPDARSSAATARASV